MHNKTSKITTIFREEFLYDYAAFHIILMEFSYFLSYTYLSETLYGETERETLSTPASPKKVAG